MLRTVAAFLLLPVSGLCWSAPGHQAIAEAAMQMLHGTSAEAKINSILKGEAPQDAAIWLDLVRENKINNKEAKKFRKAFSSNSDWHFCNFIVGSTAFTFDSKYATTNDVVPALERAIAVLEGAPSAMTKRQALRSVIHLVGDIHQPLHCITGFYNVTDLAKPVSLKDVADPRHATQDRGGNQLMYNSNENLHHFWDLVLPDGISPDVSALASKIAAASLAGEPVTAGDFHHWPDIPCKWQMQPIATLLTTRPHLWRMRNIPARRSWKSRSNCLAERPATKWTNKRQPKLS
jgi:hypothetical protein